MKIAKDKKELVRLEPPRGTESPDSQAGLRTGTDAKEGCTDQQMDERGTGALGGLACMGPGNYRCVTLHGSKEEKIMLYRLSDECKEGTGFVSSAFCPANRILL